MTSPLDDALRRTSAAVDRYGVRQDMIGLAAAALEQMPAPQRAISEMVAFTDALLHIADIHGGPHDNCAECGAIGNGLAMAMGAIRAEVDVEFTAKLDG